MRILKYIFLLILLAFIGITVYVTTQNGNFEITKSGFVKAQRSTVFDYVNDCRNWETFGSWMKKDNPIVFNYSTKTMGKGASFSWNNGSENGNCKTIFVKENDSIVQKARFNGTTSDIYLTFKDTVGGTKVTIHNKGKMDVFTKITTFFSGGITSILNDTYEKSLNNLNKTLDYEMRTYSIKVNGVSQRNSGYCLKQTVSCHFKSLTKNIKIMLPRMVHFFKKNKLTMIGKPFVMYDNITNDVVTFSVCVQTNKQIFVMPESDMTSGEMIGFTCLKTTLIGDYSHTQEAWKKAKKYIADNNFKENFTGKYIEVYTKTIDDVKKPSQWITEIYIPVFPKAEVVTPVNILPDTSSIENATPSLPETP